MFLPAAYSFVVSDGNALSFGLPGAPLADPRGRACSHLPDPRTATSGRDVFDREPVHRWRESRGNQGDTGSLRGSLGPVNAFSSAARLRTGASTVGDAERSPFLLLCRLTRWAGDGSWCSSLPAAALDVGFRGDAAVLLVASPIVPGRDDIRRRQRSWHTSGALHIRARGASSPRPGPFDAVNHAP